MASIDNRTLLARRQVRHDGRVVLFIPEGETPRVRSVTVRGDEGAQFAGRWLSAELAVRRRT
ncbi:hypothetical protein ACPPVO_20260 [Dactylosporangium sp. McL0621]|uniref:hypothetical protein n=1 Tax=Dactylosporangium sp. McL0621 TaxID=3415678 RepID=UPI003CEFD68E